MCFAGEDIDWISGPSILCAINLRVSTTVLPLSSASQSIVLKSAVPFNVEYRLPITAIGEYNNHVMDYAHAALKLIKDMEVNITPVEISIKSDFPASAGLSSSAAVSLSTLAALSKFWGLSLSTLELCNLAYSIEATELRTGAGQMDFYSCGLGGVLYIDSSLEPPKLLKKFDFPEKLKIVIADTLTSHSTKKVIHWKRERFCRHDPSIVKYAELTEASIKRMLALINRKVIDISTLGKLISGCHDYLRDYMHVSTDLLNSCVKLSIDNGALGAKLTGTGMGGCMFALAYESMTNQIVESLSFLPVKVYVTEISNDGLLIY